MDYGAAGGPSLLVRAPLWGAAAVAVDGGPPGAAATVGAWAMWA